MAVSQGKIIESLESLCSSIDKEEFIYQFLLAYGFAKAAITRLKDGSRNVASNGDIALKKQLYFRAVESGVNVYEAAEALKSESAIKSNDIRFIVVTDFDSLFAFDLKADESLDTDITLLDKQYAFFLPLAGYEKAIIYSEHPADIKASEKMGQLFDLIRERNDLSKPEDIHALNVFLTRLLFCFYAEDTGIFQQDQMTKAIESTTSITGEDLDQFFTDLFKALNLPDTALEKQALPSHLQAFPYVNGGLFKADEPVPEFGTKARRLLLECGSLSWAEINPDIFGSMFQAVIDQEQRGNLGQHYTSVSNIMKVIKPLFLDTLWDALEAARGKEKKLKELLIRLQNIRVFDPACGSGNFLIIAYKELRKIEMAVIDELNKISAQSEMYYSGIKLSQFYGIEIDDFAHEIAILSLWLAEHQMNLEFKDKFGYAPAPLPLTTSGKVFCGNSIELDWKKVCPLDGSNVSGTEVYICSNPPFLGKKEQSAKQKEEIQKIFEYSSGSGIIDYVACWYLKAAEFMKYTDAEAALVSTNSITMGEQVKPIWGELFKRGVNINFAHRTFKWKSNAKGKAAVHVVIIGFGQKDRKIKQIFESSKDDSRVIVKEVKVISPYLVEGNNLIIGNRPKPICDVPKLVEGITPLDNGILSFNEAEYANLLEREPSAASWIRPWVTGDSYLYSYKMYCLWMPDISEHQLRSMPAVRSLVEAVREFRANSKSSQKFAKTPWAFRETYMPKRVIIVPKTTSEQRDYIPIGFVEDAVVSSSCLYLEGSLYETGILMSRLSMAWLRAVGGRLESRLRYSAKLVYNNFPWPSATPNQKEVIAKLAEEVILTREDYPEQSLAKLYTPANMPAALKEVHARLDFEVEKLYREKGFTSQTAAIEFLFELHSNYVSFQSGR